MECTGRHPEKAWALCGLIAPHAGPHVLHHGVETLTWPQDLGQMTEDLHRVMAANGDHPGETVARETLADPVFVALQAVDRLTDALSRMDVKTPAGDFTLENTYGRVLRTIRQAVTHYGMVSDDQRRREVETRPLAVRLAEDGSATFVLPKTD